MKYMLLVHGAESRWTDAERAACMVESMGICDQLLAQGKFLGAAPLQPVATATTVRVRGGKTFVTAGPFAETTEHLGGYYLLDLADLDEAIAVAASLPPASKGVVEIRPLAPLDGVPPARPLPAGDPPYLLLVYHDEGVYEADGPDTLRTARAEAVERVRELDAAGRYLNASPLHPAATATCVRVRDGKRVITDGPYTETREVLGGFYLLAAGSRDAAVADAARQPGARFGAIEVRQLFDTSGLRKPVHE